MYSYPEILVSHQAYPALVESAISSYFFLRKTTEDIYPYLEIYRPLELIDKILPNTTKRDIFVFSLSLYGYYNEEHLSLKVTDKNLNLYWDKEKLDFPADQIIYSIETGFPLYLSATKLFEKHFKFENEDFFLSFWHKPTIANYWHFQLFTRDRNGQHIPRESKSGEKDDKKLKRLATVILEYVISEAICLKPEVREFRFDD